MKRVLFLLVAFLMSGTVLFAQNKGETVFGFRGGMLIGFHIEQLSFNNTNITMGSEESKFNPNIVIYVARGISDTISIQGELNFMIMQGMELAYVIDTGGLDSGQVTSKFTYTTLDIPILVKYRPVDRNFGFLAGLYLSIPLGNVSFENTSTTLSGAISGTNGSTDYYDYSTEGAAIGLTVGIFGRYPFGSGHLVGDLRFVANAAHKMEGGVEFMQRNGVAITVGYEFSF